MIDHAKHGPALNRVRGVGVLVRAAALAVVAGGIWIGAGGAPAQAAWPDTSWEAGCAWREIQPGSGDTFRQYNCVRQKECQQMANAQGSMMMDKGCFFVAPAQSSPPPAVGRTRPAQQQ